MRVDADPSPPRSPLEILRSISVPDHRSGSADSVPELGERVLIQDFCPLEDSLEWQLSHCSWQQEGLAPFGRGEVPFIVNNTAWTAKNAVRLLIATCARRSDSSSGPIRVLELGAGSGLFASHFLTAFQKLCREQCVDFADRLVYYITDGSERTVAQWEELEMFASFAGHVRLGVVDARAPRQFTSLSGETETLASISLVVANYVLDSLPCSIFRPTADGAGEEMRIRTFLRRRHAPELRRRTGLDLNAITAIAGDETADKSSLLPLLPFLEFETDYFPSPKLKESPSSQKGNASRLHPDAKRFIVNDGAIECVSHCLDSLEPEGMVLINDMGPTQPDRVSGLSFVARFGSSLAACVNFVLLDAHFSQRGCSVLKTATDDDLDIHTRVLLPPDPLGERSSHRESMEKILQETYGVSRYEKADHAADEAAAHVLGGRFKAALECFEKAMEACPDDWNILGLTAQFLTQQLLRPSEALELVEIALKINPWHSAFLWNTAGNCHFCLGSPERAHEAYLRASRIDLEEPQTYLNLAYTYLAFQNPTEALQSIARGLACDVGGRFESSLLAKQKETLAQLVQSRTEEQERLESRRKVFHEHG